MDEVTRLWFGGQDVVLEADEAITNIFPADELIALSGATNGSHLAATLTDIGVRLEARSEAVNRDTHLVQRDDGWDVLIAHIRVHHDYAGRQLAARSLVIQARAAMQLEFNSIEVYAAGNFEMAQVKFKEDRWVGYWLWPRLGFDAMMPEHVARRIRPHFRDAEYVSDLLDSDHGLDVWRIYGDSMDLTFDLTPESTSWQRLKCYTRDRNIVV